MLGVKDPGKQVIDVSLERAVLGCKRTKKKSFKNVKIVMVVVGFHLTGEYSGGTLSKSFRSLSFSFFFLIIVFVVVCFV